MIMLLSGGVCEGLTMACPCCVGGGSCDGVGGWAMVLVGDIFCFLSSDDVYICVCSAGCGSKIPVSAMLCAVRTNWRSAISCSAFSAWAEGGCNGSFV